MAGTRSDQHDAATITPPAKPIIPSITLRGAERKKNTGRVPMAVKRYVPVVATSAWKTGLKLRNASSMC
jgi:hypothetical protein